MLGGQNILHTKFHQYNNEYKDLIPEKTDRQRDRSIERDSSDLYTKCASWIFKSFSDAAADAT